MVLDFLTQYIVSVQPSQVMQVKTVSIPSIILSKLVMPWFGPLQYRLHSEPDGQVLPFFKPHRLSPSRTAKIGKNLIVTTIGYEHKYSSLKTWKMQFILSSQK